MMLKYPPVVSGTLLTSRGRHIRQSSTRVAGATPRGELFRLGSLRKSDNLILDAKESH